MNLKRSVIALAVIELLSGRSVAYLLVFNVLFAHGLQSSSIILPSISLFVYSFLRLIIVHVYDIVREDCWTSLKVDAFILYIAEYVCLVFVVGQSRDLQGVFRQKLDNPLKSLQYKTDMTYTRSYKERGILCGPATWESLPSRVAFHLMQDPSVIVWSAPRCIARAWACGRRWQWPS